MGLGHFVKSTISFVRPSWLIVKGKKLSVGKRLAITFDDGPHAIHSPEILSILSEKNIKATFFLSGKQIEKNPGLARNMYTQGHQLGNHGYLHKRVSDLDTTSYVEGVLHAQNLIEAITEQEQPRIFRPPYGSVSPACFLRLVQFQFQYVYWSLDSRDSYIRNPDALLASLLARQTCDGDILLFHEDYAHTLECLPMILDHYIESGFTFCTVTGLQKTECL